MSRMSPVKKRSLVICGALATLTGLVVVTSAHRVRAKEANVFNVLTGFSSKETCSCAFVVEQTDDYCRAFGQPAGYEVTLVIDRGAKTVSATFAGSSRVARMKEGEGCLVDALP